MKKSIIIILLILLLVGPAFGRQTVQVADRWGNAITPGQIKPGASWPVSHLNGNAAASTVLLTAPGNNRSYYLTGFLLSGGKTADGFNVLRNSCIDFDAAGEKVQVADNAVLEPATGDFSIELWVNVDATTSAIADMFHKDDGSDQGYFGELVATTSVFKFTMGDGSNTATISSTTAIDDGEWHHIVISNDDSGSDGLNLYLAGVSDATAVDATAAVSCTGGTTVFTLNGAASTQWYCSTYGFYKAGFLTAANALSRYNLGVGYKYTGSETNISYAMNIDEGVGTACYRKAGAANGAITNATWASDGIPIDPDTLSVIDIIHCANETQVDATGSYTIPTTCITFPHAIKIGRNNPLSILETDGSYTLLLFGFTDTYKRRK